MNFSEETWSARRDAFVFRCIDPLRGNRWTFCVGHGVLAELGRELERNEQIEPEHAFDRWRPQIYHAASERMRYEDSQVQQVLTADDVRAAAWATDAA